LISIAGVIAMSLAILPAPILSTQEQANVDQAMDYGQANSIPDVWAIAADRFADILAIQDPHSYNLALTYQQLRSQMLRVATALQSLGLEPGQHVALFADNSPRWLMADQGIMAAGAVDVVRGSQADTQELAFILAHSDAVALVLQDLDLLKRLTATLTQVTESGQALRWVVLLSDEAVPPDFPLPILNFTQLLAQAEGQTYRPAPRRREDLATLMYTSGTSGMPKGAMLSHGNLLSQVQGAAAVVNILPGEKVLSILPIWHAYERSFEYFTFSQGCTQVYTNIRSVKKDLKTYQPQYMVAVPRLWESIYEGIQKQFRDQPERQQKLVNFFLTKSTDYIRAKRLLAGLDLENLTPSPAQKLAAVAQLPLLWSLHQVGDRLVYQKVRAGVGGALKLVVSGGGSIAEHLEDFYELVGIEILGGYGLTETSPITHVRRLWRNIRGGDGQPLPHTETQIVDLDSRQPVPFGKSGLVLIRGRQVMQGYYKNPEATAKAIDPQGWFDTGDLGWLTPQGDLIISGRAKDTIVLTNGENVEPQPIEDACLRSAYIDQIMLVGQDEKVLGALVVPNRDAVTQWLQLQKLPLDLADSANLGSKEVQDLFKQELAREVKNRPGFRPDDRIGVFRLLPEAFTIDNGLLTQTLKIRRNVVMEHHQAIIDEMFD
jgi:long-chain acyl-CoA synthetase